MNNLVHNIITDILSALTSSDSVLLRVFSFCFLEIDFTAPVPSSKCMAAPVWLLKSGWTAKLASTNHLMQCKFPALRNSLSFVVPFRYFIILISFCQSASFGPFTRVHNTAIVGCISGLARLHRNNHFATVV